MISIEFFFCVKNVVIKMHSWRFDSISS